MVARHAVQAETIIWELDPAHSSIEFLVKHMMMTTVRGRFKSVRATLTTDEAHPEQSHVEVEIDTASLDTGVADRDAHLRSGDFFEVERYPVITFRSQHVEGAAEHAGDRFRLVGDLRIRDTTLEVVLDCEFQGRGQDPWGKERAGFTARGEIDRREWGLKWNQALEAGGILVANKVRIDADVEFVKHTE